MCGITGIYAFNEAGRFHLINLQRSTDVLSHRGPDAQGTFIDDRVGLGHRRLAVIDTSPRANQPMKDPTGRYTLVYNGEIYNHRELRKLMEDKYRVQFSSHSDTEVLLHAFIIFGRQCLTMLNGFFAFAIYDKSEKELFIARDRLGIKPLYFYHDEDKFLFASEMRSIISYGIQRSLNEESLLLYLQLNYIPAPFSMLRGVSKLLPGQYIKIKNRNVEISRYYDLKAHIQERRPVSYKEIKDQLIHKLEQSVRQRLVADVPVGVFLSGGVDSSLITALASRNRENLMTFSIGYKHAHFFDEKKYSEQVAKHFNTDHHVFDISNEDLLSHFTAILEHFDEPFADSSAIPVYLLSKLTRSKVTVALSGDGADEVFTGYNKHLAFYKALQGGLLTELTKTFAPLWRKLPQSRNNFLFNRFRQLDRYAKGLELNAGERYWLWARLMTEQKAQTFCTFRILENYDGQKTSQFIDDLTGPLHYPHSIRDILMADTQLVLPNDMLFKVDLMSMAHGLEVRVPFLDHEVVEFAFSIPDAYKMDHKRQKIILRDILKDLLPGKLYQRPKHGFEVPLLSWFRKDLKTMLTHELLDDALIGDQGIFDIKRIRFLKSQLFSSSPGDAHAHIWALVVFQAWWKKYFS